MPRKKKTSLVTEEKEKTLVEKLNESKVLHGIVPRERWTKLIEFMHPVVEGLFPGAWDFQIVDEDGGDWTLTQRIGILTLYYPKVTILTTKNVLYPITDLYVRVKFDSSCNILGSISGTRSSLTRLEFTSMFAHPHLTSNARDSFNDFCQGSTHLRDILSKLALQEVLNSDGVPNLNSEMLFEAFLHQLGAYVSHEGHNPFQFIHQIGSGSSSRYINGPELEDNYDRFRNKCLASGYVPATYLERGVPRIVQDSPELEDMLLRIATRTQYRSADGEFYENLVTQDSSGQLRNDNFESFIFRGEEITQTIIQHEQKQQDETRQKYCHRTIKEYIIKELESKVSARIGEEQARRLYEVVKASRTRNSKKRPIASEGQADYQAEGFFEGLVSIGQNTP